MASRPGTRASSAALLSKRTPSFRRAVALVRKGTFTEVFHHREPLRLGRGSRVFEDSDNGISRTWPPPTGRSVSHANRQTPDSKAPAQAERKRNNAKSHTTTPRGLLGSRTTTEETRRVAVFGRSRIFPPNPSLPNAVKFRKVPC